MATKAYSRWTRGREVDKELEPADRLIARLRTFDGNVERFSRGQFGRVLAARWIGAPALEGRHLALDVVSLSILSREPRSPQAPVIAL